MQSALASALFTSSKCCSKPLRNLLTVVILCTCMFAGAQTPSTPYIPSAGKTVIGRFAGVVLCANCPGIRTELSLFENIDDPFIKTFVMRETYLRSPQPAATIVSHGRWDINRGRNGDPNATVFVLNVDGASVNRFYLLQDKQTLRMLDGDLGLLPAELPQTLHRMSPRNKKMSH